MTTLTSEARDAVSHPGKFEGEPPMTYVLWQASLDGCDQEIADETADLWYGLIGRWILFTDSRGFVYSERYADRLAAAYAFDTICDQISQESQDW